jgi:hypothetical protein
VSLFNDQVEFPIDLDYPFLILYTTLLGKIWDELVEVPAILFFSFLCGRLGHCSPPNLGRCRTYDILTGQ